MNFNIVKAAGELVDKLLGRVDGLITSKEEKMKLTNDFTSIVNERLNAIQEHVTTRHKTDMASDSWLSKNIRPLTLIFILVTYTAFSLADGNIGAFNINENYVTLLGEWGRAIMYFYFGGRTIEKAVQLFKNKKLKANS